MEGRLSRRSSRGAQFRRWVPKTKKLKSGRKDVRLVPAHIRVFGVDLSKDQRAFIRKKLGRRLEKFGGSIERVSVRVKDVNGPRGGVDKVCRIKVVLSNLPSVVFEAQDASLDVAVSSALAGAERAVRRSVDRRRVKGMKGRTRPRAGLGRMQG
jgi:hypothetical protein